MGGGSITTTPLSTTPSEDEQDLSQLSPSSLKPHPLSSDELKGEVAEETINEDDHGSVFGGLEEMGPRISPTCLEEEANLRRRSSAYKEVLESYQQLEVRTKSLKEAKSKILSYTPGAWVEKVGNIDYDVPSTTTLLLVGPKGSGKSSLVNRITNVFEDDMYASERAQVSYNSSTEDGTYFLQAYMIPRGSTSFCLYDTRGLSDVTKENFAMLKYCIAEGVRDGKLITRLSDSSTLKTRMKSKARKSSHQYKERRMVNFVIFVVDALAVLKSMNGDLDGEAKYTRTLAATFKCPYLAFKDDKPVVVVTHGDLLSLADRARVRVHLGELLGIPPAKQIFDIPDNREPVTELTIVDMLRHSLEHADKHLPPKEWLAEKFHGVSIAAVLFVCMILLIAIISACIQHSHSVRAQKSKLDTDWASIRHMWGWDKMKTKNVVSFPGLQLGLSRGLHRKM